MSEPPALCPQALLDFVRDVATEAGNLTLDWFDKGVEVETKGDGTPVTIADKSAERLVRERIHSAFPEDSIVGEEETDFVGTSQRTWIIDPIDGTKAFVRGVPLYSTLIAVEDSYGSLAGAIALPPLARVTYAGRGMGTWTNGQRVAVSRTKSLEGAMVLTSGVDAWQPERITALMKSGALIRTWGDGYGWAMVVEGRADAIIDPIVSRWDVAAMPVLYSEAGGRYSDLEGQPRARTGTAIGSNGLLHDQLIDLVGP
jgi:histidinol phosphatase-like enzyme (inositol monophosphatase family)